MYIQIVKVLSIYFVYIVLGFLIYLLIEYLLTDDIVTLTYFNIFYSFSFLFVIIFFLIKNKENFQFFVHKHLVTIFDICVFFLVAVFFRIAIDPVFRFNEIVNGLSYDVSRSYKSPAFEVLTVLTFIETVIISPIIEELIFREYLISELIFIKMRKYNIFLLSSLLFSIIHFSFTQIGVTFIFGIILSFTYFKKGVIGSIVVHMFYNLLWLILDYYRNIYWGSIEFLNFGYYYWSIIISSILILVGIYKIIQKGYSHSSA